MSSYIGKFGYTTFGFTPEKVTNLKTVKTPKPLPRPPADELSELPTKKPLPPLWISEQKHLVDKGPCVIPPEGNERSYKQQRTLRTKHGITDYMPVDHFRSVDKYTCSVNCIVEKLPSTRSNGHQMTLEPRYPRRVGGDSQYAESIALSDLLFTLH